MQLSEVISSAETALRLKLNISSLCGTIMTNDYCMGIIEVVYNPNGHTYWVEGIVNDETVEFHHTTSMSESCTFEQILLDKVREYNSEYRIALRDLSYGNKNKYLYEVLW